MRGVEKDKRPIGQLSVWCALYFSRMEYCCICGMADLGRNYYPKRSTLVYAKVTLRSLIWPTLMYLSSFISSLCFEFKTLGEIQYCRCIYCLEDTLLDYVSHTLFLLPRIPLVGLSLQFSPMPPTLTNKFFSPCLCAFQVHLFCNTMFYIILCLFPKRT